MISWLLGSILAAAAPAPAPRAKEAPTKPPTGVAIQVAEYARLPGGRSLHLEIARPAAPARGLLPAVIYIHGGGWWAGVYRPDPQVWLVPHGYVVASIEYRLSDEAKWPAQIEDCKLAVRWLRRHAADYGVDSERIGCWGVSAGGHLAACLGTMAQERRFDQEGEPTDVSSAVKAVVDWCGPTDFTQGSDGIVGAPPGKDASILVRLLGAGFQATPERWRDASPIRYVRPGDPPFFIAHGSIDRTVPPRQSDVFAAALRRAGVSVTFVSVVGGAHPLRAPAGMPPAQPDIATLRNDVLQFLDQHLKR